MYFLPFLYPTFTLLALLSFSSDTVLAKKPPKDAILLSQVKSLTLRANAKTSHRRVAAVPQLTCKGPGCAHYKVEVMRCTNQGGGYNDEDIQWSCVADIPVEFKLGSTEVICEGYANRDDPYVLKGSCGVEYRLLLTDAGEEKYGNSYWGGGKSDGEGWTWSSVLFVFIFLGVLFWIIYAAYQAVPAARRIPRRPGGFWGGGWGPGGGGPGGGDPWDPPPPYPGKRYNYGQQEGWRPGFWTGAATGAAAGYMAGNRGQQQQQPIPPRGGGWFGGGNSGGYDAAPRRNGSSSSSSTRHESTGFGSTSRR
jgi:hypothetical protein